MSLLFSRNDTFGPQSMFINVVIPGQDRSAHSAVESVSFSVYKGKSPNLVTFSEFNLPAKEVPARPGTWYAPYTIPVDASFGPYTVSWEIHLVGDEIHHVEQLFYIEDVQAIQTEGSSATVVLDGTTITARIMRLLKHIRMALRDNNPDRNYHAVPPRSSREVQGFSNRVGFIWTDEELLSYTLVALSDLNSNNPKATRSYGLSEFPDYWLGVLVDLACVRALQALAINWVQDEFGYSISGISLDLSKADKLSAMRSALESSGLQVRKDNATAIRPIGRATAPARWNI